MEEIIPPAQITLVPAGWRDVGELKTLEKISFGRHAWPLIDLLAVLMAPGIIRIKACCDNRMAGFIAGEKRSDGSGWITTIAVMPAYRKQGIATQLIDTCEKQLNTKLYKLCVMVENQAAIKLYQKLGYRKTDLWEDYYGKGEHALLMVKRPTKPENLNEL